VGFGANILFRPIILSLIYGVLQRGFTAKEEAETKHLRATQAMAAALHAKLFSACSPRASP
jgi:hypothetical protein